MMETWNEYTKLTTEAASDFIELNIKTLNHLIHESTNLTDLFHIKNPVDFVIARAKFMNDVNIEAMHYMQEAYDIWFKIASHAAHMFTDTAEETTKKASEIIKVSSAKKHPAYS